MAKPFELYVYAQLRIFFPSEGTLHYQFSSNHQYLDFLCTAKDRCFAPSLDGFFIADAKYKPRNAEGNVAIVDDMRQLAGYARLAGVRDECRRRGWDDRSSDLPGVILYADPNAPTTLDWDRLEPIRGWERMFTIGLGVPAESAE